MTNQMVHLGPSPAPSVLLAKINGDNYNCPGCKVTLCRLHLASKIPMYCPRCSAVLWYYYMGSIETISLEDIRNRELPEDKHSWEPIDACQYFIRKYEAATGETIESSEAVYPAFGVYFNSKIARYAEQLLNTLFDNDVSILAHYIDVFIASLQYKEGFHWSWLGNFKIAEQYLQKRHQRGM